MLVTESTQKMASIEAHVNKLSATTRYNSYLFQSSPYQSDSLLDDVLMDDSLLVFFIDAPSLDQTL